MNPKTKREKRRTCWHRLRHWRAHRRRRPDPATSVFMQLLAIMLALFGRAPVLPSWPAARAEPQTRTVRRKDWSRERQEREEGKGGQHLIDMSPRPSHGKYPVTPSYRRLVRDLRRPHAAARAEATAVLRRRVPLEALPWLEKVLEHQDWPALAWCARPGMTKEESEKAMLRSALTGTEARVARGQEGPDGTTPPGPP